MHRSVDDLGTSLGGHAFSRRQLFEGIVASLVPGALASQARAQSIPTRAPEPYQRYYATREANDNMRSPPQGVHAFLRAYYHMKSADWKQNKPFPLKARTADEWAKLPRYYVMDLGKGMAETVASEIPSAAEIATCKWLPEEDLRVYSTEYGRTGFQGGLQGYRGGTSAYANETQTFAGRTIDQPSMFIGGKSDWGVFQGPGAFERMQKTACTHMVGAHLVEGAGHWVQQEQPEAVSELLLQFLKDHTPVRGGG